MMMTEAYEEMVYREGYRRGKAERHKMLEDGTLVVSVDDATAVTRVLVEDDKKNGDLYYTDRPKGEWEFRFVGTEGRWYCSVCNGWQTYGEIDFCPNCGADMRGEDNE